MQDVLVIGAVLLFFGVVLLFGSKIMGEFNTHIQANANIPTEAKTASTTLNGHYGGTLDYGFLMLAVGIAIATLVLAALVRIHPIFIPLFFIGLVLVIFLSAIFSNIYQDMAANSALTSFADELVFTSHILTFLPLIVGIFGILLMMVMYKMWSVNQ